jgi:3-deoxy-D-manno-octulosonic-acid transferase
MWREALARAAYSALLRLATPIYLIRLLARSRREPLYRTALGERLGYGARAEPGRLWIHAVSLGETRAAAALIEELRRQRPGLRLLLTHGTATGRAAGTALLRAGDAQAWLPYDTPGAVRRFLARQRPGMGVLMETEVWPNLLHGARAAGVPVVLANARLSARSLAKGQGMAALLRPAAGALSATLAQTEADAKRLRAMGVAAVEALGNIKFDMSPSVTLLERGRAWRERLAQLGRPVLLMASSREGEEAVLLQAWRASAGAAARRVLLLIVPRHPQRFDEVAAIVGTLGFTLARRSCFGDEPGASEMAADVWLGDSLGEMPLYYALAGVALLGGSFASLGGQNLIEAAACGCPLLMGPHTFNFAAAAEDALAAGAAQRVPDLEAAVGEALKALSPALAGDLERRAQAARSFAAAHRGAAERTAARLLKLLPA